MGAEVKKMLLQFRVKNFKSIGDEIVVDFVAGKGREHAHFLIVKNGVRVLPSVVFYGANASGKSNIVQAMTYMLGNIANSAAIAIAKENLVIPFLFDEMASKEPTEMELFVALDGYEYQYGYIVEKKVVLGEWLWRKKLSNRATKEEMIFERHGEDITFGEDFEAYAKYAELKSENILSVSILGHLSDMEGSIFTLLTWAFRSYEITNPSSMMRSEMLAIYLENETLRLNALQFIQEFDPNIENITINEEQNTEGETRYRAFTWHNGKAYPLEIESTGTQKLFNLYLTIFIALNSQQSTLIFDELDTYLHPLIIRRILGMFHNKEINKMESQLITTSHNLIAMNKNDLRRDQIWLVEKDERGFTDTYSLSSFIAKGNGQYEKDYLAGKFGAIPYANMGGGR